MRILWVSHLLPYPPKGGVMQRSFNLIKEASKEHQVFLFAFNQKAWLPREQDVERAKKHLRSYCELVEVFDIPTDSSRLKWWLLLAWSLLSKRPYTVNWTTSSHMRGALEKFLVSEKVDLIHCDTIGLTENIPADSDQPRVLNHHNIESHMMLRRAEREKNAFKKMYFLIEGKKLEKYEVKDCRKFRPNVVVSELDAQRLKLLDPRLEVKVVPNGVDVDYFRPVGAPARKNSVIFAGSMDWYPNEDAMIYFLTDIWPEIRRRYPGAQLTIAGRRPSSSLRKLANEVGSVRVTGFVEDIRPFIDSAEIYVCPIRDGGGTKLKLLDAMAMGKPIVTTSVGAEGLNVKDGRHVLIADTAGGFVEKMCALFENVALRKELSVNSRRFVEQFYSWEVIGKKLFGAYEAAVRG